MKVLAVSGSYFPRSGGAEKYLRSVLEHRAKIGDDIKVLVNHNAADDPRRSYSYQYGSADVRSIKSLNIFGLIIITSMRSIKDIFVMVKKADIIFVNDIRFLNLSILFAAILFRKPIVLVSHGFYFHTKSRMLIKRLYMRLCAFASRFFRAVILVSETDHVVARKYGLQNTKFIEEGVDFQDFAVIPNCTEPNRFLYFGRVDRNKGLQHLIRKLSDFAFPFQLRVVGRIDDVAYYGELVRQVEYLGLQESIEFAGEVSFEELLSELSCAEFVFLPSSFEGFGITLIEALAAGKNVICQNNDSYRVICQRLGLEHILFDFTGDEPLQKKIEEVRRSGCFPNDLSYYHPSRMLEDIDGVLDVV